MTAWIAFEGRLEAMEWGRSVYVVLPLPPEVTDALPLARTRRVDGEIDVHPVSLAVTTGPACARPFLYVNKTLVRALGVGPGDPVEVRLRPADADRVDLAGDVADALRAAGCNAAWDALSPGKRRGLLHPVETARRPETRARRISALVAGLTGPSAP